MQMKYSTLCFDLDGTLLDTTEGVLYAVRKTISKLGLCMPNESILATFVGPPMQLSFETHFKMGKEEALEAANLFRYIYKQESLFKASLYPNVIDTLKYLKDAGLKIVVATNKSHDNAIEILKYFHIYDMCDYAMGSDLQGLLKKRDIIERCINAIDVDIAECVYVGDSIFDYEGANALGMDFIGVTYGFGFKKNDTFFEDKDVIEVDVFSRIKEVLF